MFKRRKILSLLMSLVMIMSMFAGIEISTVAEDDVPAYLSYRIDGTEVTITDCDTSASGNLIIPDTIEGYPVTKIREWAFGDCKLITNVTFADSIRYIGEKAFYECESLTSVSFPDSIETIDSYAFMACSNLKSITLPEHGVTIAYDAFSGTPFLESDSNRINGVLFAGKHLISVKTDLDTYVVPEGTVSIASNAFKYCKNLTSAYLPSSITHIGSSTYYPDKIYYSGSILDWSNIEGGYLVDNKSDIYYYDGNISYTTYGNYLEITECSDTADYVYIPSVLISRSGYSSTTYILSEINEGIFSDCTNLREVYFAGTQEEWNNISIGANNDCLTNAKIYFAEDLNYIIKNGEAVITGCNIESEKYVISEKWGYIPVTEIADSAFRDADIKSIIIPELITRIGDYAFKGSDITEITLHKYIDTVGSNIFENCKLEKVYFTGSEAQWPSVAEKFKDSIIFDEVDVIFKCENMFFSLNGDEAIIMGCTDDPVDDLVIPDELNGHPVTKISPDAFAGCLSLTSVTFNTNIQRIEDYSFKGCTALTNITLHPNLTWIGYNAFGGCINLTDIYFTGTKRDWSITIVNGIESMNSPVIHYPDSSADVLEYKIINDEAVITGCDVSASGEIKIPETLSGAPVTTIKDYAFYFCDGIEKVSIPASVTTIEPSAFYTAYGTIKGITVDNANPVYSSDKHGVLFNKNKTVLIQYPSANTDSSYTIPSTVTEIADWAFEDASNLTNIEIPENVTALGTRAFALSGLKTVYIHSGITTIGESPFYACPNLTAINVDTENKHYSSDSNGVLYNKDKTILIQYPAGKTDSSFVVPSSVSIIGVLAFGNSVDLRDVTLTNVTEIKNASFYWCTFLSSLTMGSSIKTIEDEAFVYCDSLYSGDVYYGGSEAEWKKINIGYYNESLTDAKIHYNCETETEDPTTEPTIEETTTEEPTTKEPVTDAPTTGKPVEKPTEAPTQKPTEKPTQKPVSDKLEVSGDTVKVDNSSKISTVKTKSSADDIIKSVKNEKVSIVDKNGKAISGDALVGTGSKIQIKDKSGKVVSTYTVCVPNDVDGNGKTTAADARLALRGSAKLNKIEGVYAQASDATSDKKITAADARKILRISAGLEKA